MWSVPVRRFLFTESPGYAQAIMKFPGHSARYQRALDRVGSDPKPMPRSDGNSTGLRSAMLGLSIPANGLERAENDRDERKPEKPPDKVHSEKVIPIVEVEHADSPRGVKVNIPSRA